MASTECRLRSMPGHSSVGGGEIAATLRDTAARDPGGSCYDSDCLSRRWAILASFIVVSLNYSLVVGTNLLSASYSLQR